MRRSYTYRCTGCGHMYSWTPETEDEKPQRCGIKGCAGHGKKVT